MKIQNADALAGDNALRRDALSILEAGYEAIDTGKVIRRAVAISSESLIVQGQAVSLQGAKRIHVIGVGKCSYDAALTLEDVLGSRLEGGIVLDVEVGDALKKLIAIRGDHPFSTEVNISATAKIIEYLKALTEEDFVIFVISGGGSALLCQPQNISLEEETVLIKQLMHAGATIQETNTVRKHLSIARGGYLAEHAFPARGTALIFSDVPGDDIAFISSGPTVKDETTAEDARAMLSKYGINEPAGGFIETPKDEKYFEGIPPFLLVSNRLALEAMAWRSRELGYNTEIKDSRLKGEAREVGLGIASDISAETSKRALLLAGEMTVSIKGSGKGGRNMEACLAGLSAIKPGSLFISAASDGVDNSDRAGAICDMITKEHAANLNLDAHEYLANNDSYSFFSRIGDFISTGDTRSNVADILLALHE